MATQDISAQFTFFFPEARVLSGAEVEALPPGKKAGGCKIGAAGCLA